MGCLYSKMSRDSDDHYEKITDEDIDLATSADVESENDVVCGPEGKSDILDLKSSKDLEDGQNPSLDRERQDDAAQRMQVLKDITRAQLEELRRARDRLFKAYIYQEAQQLARVFTEAASAEVAQQQPLTNEDTWLTPGGEGWEEEMTSFLTTEVGVLLKEDEQKVEAGKEEEEEKEKKGEMGDGEGVPSSVRHEALLVADMFRQSPNIDLVIPNEDLEDGQNPSLDRERQDDTAQRMQVLKDITRAQLEELRRARDRLFKAYIYQEAQQLARVFTEAASAEVAQQHPLTDDDTWLTPGGEGWEGEMTSFLTTEVGVLLREDEAASAEVAQQQPLTDGDTWLTPGGEGWEEEMTSFLTTEVDVLLREDEEKVEAGKEEEEEEKEKKGEMGDGEGVPSSVRHEALLVADMFRQGPNIDLVIPNESEEEHEKEGEEKNHTEKEQKEEMGDGQELHASLFCEALQVADTIRQSPNINPHQDGENIAENASSRGCYEDEILDDEQTTPSCLDEEGSANIFLHNVMEAVGFMAQESTLLNERAFLNKKIAYMQMLVLRRERARFVEAHTGKEAPMETPPSHAEQTPRDESPSPYQTLVMNTGGDKTTTSYRGDPSSDAEEGVPASSTEDCDDALVEMRDEMEDDIDDDSDHGDSGSVRVFLDWLMGEVEARVKLDQRLLSLGGRVPFQSDFGIPAFPGTSGMTWDEALKHIHREDVRRGKEEEEKRDSEGEQEPGLRRKAARNSWLFKLILQLDAEDEEREQLAVRCQTMTASRED